MSITCNGLPAGIMHFRSTSRFSIRNVIEGIYFVPHFPLIAPVLLNIYLIYTAFRLVEKSPNFVHSRFPLIGQSNNSGTKTVMQSEAHRFDSNMIKLAC